MKSIINKIQLIQKVYPKQGNEGLSNILSEIETELEQKEKEHEFAILEYKEQNETLKQELDSIKQEQERIKVEIQTKINQLNETFSSLGIRAIDTKELNIEEPKNKIYFH